MYALMIMLLCALLYALCPFIALYGLYFELFRPTPYQASAKCKLRCMRRTQGFMAILSISSYFNAALCIPAMCKLQTIQAELSNDK
jgi:hypothetical protein